MAIIEVETNRHAGFVHIALKGELDLSSAPKVKQEIEEAERDEPQVIALDLGKLTFLDSSGLRLVVAANKRAEQTGRRFVVVRGTDAVHRVFTITNLDDQIDIVDDLSSLSSPSGS